MYFFVYRLSVFFQRDDLIRTCRMTKMLEQSDWQAMIDEALGARRPSRSVAAYYAIALAETGLLESRAFEIPYDYPNRKVREKDGRMTDGISIYTLDADFTPVWQIRHTIIAWK